MSPRLSAVLIARDEANVIERCLRSLQGTVDEIVVLDTGSTDETPTLASRCGASVYHGTWTHDFAAARNAALVHASGDWILWIDADEELVAPTEKVRALMEGEYGAYDVEIENFVDDRPDGDRFVHPALRLFRRNENTAWEGRVHEQVVAFDGSRGQAEGPFLRHYGYQPAIMTAKNKAARTISLLEKALEETPDDAFQRFNLANALLVDGRREEAYSHAILATEGLPSDASFGALAWHVRLQCAPDAIAEAALADTAGWGGLFVEYERAQAFLRLGDAKRALAACDRAVSLPWPKGSAGDRGIATHKARLVRAQALLSLGCEAEALRDIEMALPFDPGFGPMRRLRAEVRRRLGLPFAEDLRIAWESSPDDSELWTAWLEAGDGAGRLSAYEKLAERQELSSGLLVNWARELEDAGQADRALELYVQAVQRAPRDANAHLNCGDALGRRGAWTDAASLYVAAIRLDPGNAQAWFTLGNAYAHLGHAEAAIKAYDQCLALNPEHGPASHNRAIVADEALAA
ncbi:tetratricopeptide repeat protein [bacterium]|nr:MAG: tetratricopeptide repeat protein [bacterium]